MAVAAAAAAAAAGILVFSPGGACTKVTFLGGPAGLGVAASVGVGGAWVKSGWRSCGQADVSPSGVPEMNSCTCMHSKFSTYKHTYIYICMYINIYMHVCTQF